VSQIPLVVGLIEISAEMARLRNRLPLLGAPDSSVCGQRESRVSGALNQALGGRDARRVFGQARKGSPGSPVPNGVASLPPLCRCVRVLPRHERIQKIQISLARFLFRSALLLPRAFGSQAVLGAGTACCCPRNRTSRFKFWAVAAIRNCSATFHRRRSRTGRSRTRCFSSANRASILYRARCVKICPAAV
jgi:hypothetical protein